MDKLSRGEIFFSLIPVFVILSDLFPFESSCFQLEGKGKILSSVMLGSGVFYLDPERDLSMPS